VAVVLAAGGGSRFAGPTPKLLAPVRGRPLVVHAVAAAVEAAVGPVVVVSGAVDVAGALVEAGLLDQVEVVANPRWSDGQARSLAVGLATADRLGADAAVVGLGDQPGVPAEAWRRVAAAGPDAPIVVATYDGRRRNPVRLARSIWAELPTSGDQGARSLMAGRPELVAEIGCPGQPADVDTLEDLARWS
jgi:CTP:molybdopterin cytidylyltransferase MocA